MVTIETEHVQNLADLNADYQAQVAANNAQYTPHLYRWVTQKTGWGKSVSYRRVRVLNQAIANALAQANAQAQVDLDQRTAAAVAQYHVDIAQIQNQIDSGGDMALLQDQIDQIQADLDNQLATFEAERVTINAQLNDAVAEALNQVNAAQELEADYAAAQTAAVAEGSVQMGYETSAAALTDLRFANINEVAEDPNSTSLSTNAQATLQVLRDEDFVDATAWRYAADRMVKAGDATVRSLVYGGYDATINAIGSVDNPEAVGGPLSDEDTNIYITGGSIVGANNDTTLQAENIQVVGIRDSYIGQGNTIENAFQYLNDSDSDTVNAGTFQRRYMDPETGEVVNEAVRDYELSISTIMAGNDLTLRANDTIDNYGGSIAAQNNLIVTAQNDINITAVRYNFALSAEHGCGYLACGWEGNAFSPGELLSGADLILTSATGSINNIGGHIAAANSAMLTAANDIRNEALTGGAYTYYWLKRRSLTSNKTIIKQTAALQSGNITTQFGDIIIKSEDGDVTNLGSVMSAGGTIDIDAGNDVIMDALSVELHNIDKRRGFSGLSYSSNKTYWNNFVTALPSLEGDNVGINAGNNITGIGATIMARNDLDLLAANNLTFDAEQNQKYLHREGWSIGVSFPGSGIIDGILQGDERAAFEAYMQTNPLLSSIHQLSSADDGWGVANGMLALVYNAPKVFSAANQLAQGPQHTPGSALAQQFNPFYDLRNNTLLNPGANCTGRFC